MLWDVTVVCKFMQNSYEHEGGGELVEEGFRLNRRVYAGGRRI